MPYFVLCNWPTLADFSSLLNQRFIVAILDCLLTSGQVFTQLQIICVVTWICHHLSNKSKTFPAIILLLHLVYIPVFQAASVVGPLRSQGFTMSAEQDAVIYLGFLCLAWSGPFVD